MKITAIRPLIVAEARNYFFVIVETDAGVRGVGEGGHHVAREGDGAGLSRPWRRR